MAQDFASGYSIMATISTVLSVVECISLMDDISDITSTLVGVISYGSQGWGEGERMDNFSRLLENAMAPPAAFVTSLDRPGGSS